jgi:hypothetical protein
LFRVAFGDEPAGRHHRVVGAAADALSAARWLSVFGPVAEPQHRAPRAARFHMREGRGRFLERSDLADGQLQPSFGRRNASAGV